MTVESYRNTDLSSSSTVIMDAKQRGGCSQKALILMWPRGTHNRGGPNLIAD
jgi:hypothetical protein